MKAGFDPRILLATFKIITSLIHLAPSIRFQLYGEHIPIRTNCVTPVHFKSQVNILLPDRSAQEPQEIKSNPFDKAKNKKETLKLAE